MADIDVKQALADGELFVRNGDNVDGISKASLAADDAFTGAFQPLDSDLTDLASRWAAATASGASALQFLEDTDNGTNKVTVAGPASVASDRTVTLPDASGTVALAESVTVTDVTGTSDTIAAGDLGKILRYTDSSKVTVTLPNGLAVGSQVNLLFWGAAGGAVQDDGTSTVQPEGDVAQYGEVSCVVVATNTWSVQGPVS